MLRKKQKRVTKNDWLVAAIDMLENDGIEKTSACAFYWEIGVWGASCILPAYNRREVSTKIRFVSGL